MLKSTRTYVTKVIKYEMKYALLIFFIQDTASGQIHLLKLTRLLRLARLLQKMDRYSQYSAMILTLLMLSFTIVAHWLACIWYVIAEKERSKYDKSWDLGKRHYGNYFLANRKGKTAYFYNLIFLVFRMVTHIGRETED